MANPTDSILGMLPAGGDGSRQPRIELLAYLSQAAGLAHDPSLIQEAALEASQEFPQPNKDNWEKWLDRAGRVAGLRIRHETCALRDAVHLVARSTPLVLWVASPTADEGWLAVAERSSRQFRLVRFERGIRSEWVDEQELPARLGVPNLDAEVSWASAEPLLVAIEPAENEEAALEHMTIHPMRRLMHLVRQERTDIWVVAVLACGVGVLMLAMPLAVEALVNTAGAAQLFQQVLVLTGIAFACLALANVMRGVEIYVVEYLQQRLFVRIVADLAYRLPRVRIDAFDREHGPEIVNRFFEVVTVQKASASLLLDGMVVFINACIGLLVLALYHPLLLGFDVVLLALLTFIIFFLGRGAVSTSIRESESKYRMASWLEEMVRHPMAFKLQGGHEYLLHRADWLARDYLNARRRHFRILFRQVLFSLSLYVIANVALLGVGGWLVVVRQLTLGQLVAAELIVSVSIASIVKLGKSLENFYDLMASMNKLGMLIDLPLERTTGAAVLPTTAPASLNIGGLSFAFANARSPVISNFSLTLASGERLALLGPSGAGKSTLTDLIFGLREAQQGHIVLDGYDVRDIRLDDLRRHVAAVKNEFEIFAATVLDNIRLDRPSVSTMDVRTALAAVDLLDTILSLPNGLLTPLSIGGAPLSHGQALRLVLARAIAGRPRLLVLDEVLDGLAPEIRSRILPTFIDRNAPWSLLLITAEADLANQCDRQIQCASLDGPSGDVLST